MAAVMTLGAPHASFNPTRRDTRSIGRVAAVLAIVVSLFALSVAPSSALVPETVSSAVSAVMPDFVEDLFTANQADAWNPWKTVRNTFLGAAAGGAAGCAVGAVAGMVVASGPGCVGMGGVGAVSGAIGGFWSSF